MLKCPLSPLLSGVSLFAIAPASAFAMQEVPEAEVTAEESETVIIVTAERVRGAVETDAAPIDELSEADVQALGGSSVADIVAAVAPQAGSGRGRGSGPPVILLNGQRISSFRDIRAGSRASQRAGAAGADSHMAAGSAHGSDQPTAHGHGDRRHRGNIRSNRPAANVNRTKFGTATLLADKPRFSRRFFCQHQPFFAVFGVQSSSGCRLGCNR